jgi:predicted MFS family arabinose efflux permease
MMALTTLLFTTVDRLWAALPLVAVVGFCMSGAGIASQTLVQLSVPSSLQGRVLSLHGLIFRAGPALGALGMGAASEQFGFRVPVALGASIAAGAATCFWLRQGRFAALLERS